MHHPDFWKVVFAVAIWATLALVIGIAIYSAWKCGCRNRPDKWEEHAAPYLTFKPEDDLAIINSVREARQAGRMPLTLADLIGPDGRAPIFPGEEPPPWPHQDVKLDPAAIYRRWNGETGKARFVGKHPALAAPYTTHAADAGVIVKRQCPHCDEFHEPGRCRFRVRGIDTDPGQLGGD